MERRGPQHVTNCFFLRSLIMYGMQIVDENGAMWMSPDFTPMNLIDRAVIPGNNGYVFQSRIPDNMQCMFFIRFDNDAVCITREFSQNGFKCLQIIRTTGTGNITVYAFGNMVIDVPRYGSFIFDASGRMVYHAGMKPLEVQTTAISGNMKPRDMGQPIAVSPCASSLISQRTGQLWTIFRSFTGAYGNFLSNNAIPAGQSAGPAGFVYQTTALFIFSSKYD